MIKTLLSLFCLLLLISYGQWEYAIGAGMSVNSTPSDNMYYQADKYIPNYAVSGSLVDNIGKDKSWQVGIQLHCLQLANKSSKPFASDNLSAYAYNTNATVGNDGTKFVFGQYTVSATLIANKKIPVSQKAEMYIGIAAGYSSIRNCRGTGSPVVAYLAPDGGQGPVYGGQIGFIAKSNNNTSFYMELAPRFYSVTFSGTQAPFTQTPHPDLKFNTIAYPITLGYRYTFPDNHGKGLSKQHMERFVSFDQLEIGLGGGISENGTPQGNAYYLGDQMIPNYAVSVVVANNFGAAGVWQAGLEAHVLELASTSSISYTGEDRPTVGGDSKKIVYSKITTDICAIGNRKFKISHNEFYVGVAVGLGIARNNNHYTPDESYVAPDGGRGMVFGAQAGYTLNITQNFGLNIEVAPRYYCLAYDAEAPYFIKPHNNLYYNVWAYPVTFGFRIKLNRPSDDDVPVFDIDRYQRKRENWHE
jgi:hypothetical protein